MKNIFLILICLSLSLGVKAQSLIGAWEMVQDSQTGKKIKTVMVFTDGYQSTTTYDAETGAFIATQGGSWELKGGTLFLKMEFDSSHPDSVGTDVILKVSISDSVLSLEETGDKLQKVDDGTPGKLAGAWLMSGRNVDGEFQSRSMDNSRKTMKILSGTRFQWIAYDVDKKQFMATGGGTYTTVDGTYTENIEFFSRDASRVGMSLKFNYELTDGDWRHTGLSSKGDPIDETWSLRP